MKIPATKPFFSEKSIVFILDRFRQILEGKSFLTMGKYCQEFEEKFADYVGTKYAVTTNSGTAALEIVLQILGVKGYEVIVPTNTFAATAFAVIKAGGKPLFVDCGQDLTTDPSSVKDKLTAATKAVVTVHIGGLISPATYELRDICQKRGIHLVEDACHAHGSSLDGKKAGTFGVAGAFSFFSTKVMTTGEGGMIVTDDEEIRNKALVLRDQAKKAKGGYQNYHEEVGYNWRMTEVQALMGLAQLEMLEEFVDRRNQIARIYDQELQDLSNLTVLRTPSNARHNYYKYIAFLDGMDRDKLNRHLKEKYDVSLGGYVYEIPLHQQPVFAQYRQGSLPIAEDLCQRQVCLPVYYAMTNKEARYAALSMRDAIQEQSYP
jgi:dTDP-4-amino-4,6-dideoxygalactose transaminase